MQIIALILILLMAAFTIWMIERARTREQDFLLRVFDTTLNQAHADNVALRNRMFMAKGQPPVGVDVAKKYEEKQKASEEKKDTPPALRPDPIDPVQKMRMDAAELERKDLQKG